MPLFGKKKSESLKQPEQKSNGNHIESKNRKSSTPTSPTSDSDKNYYPSADDLTQTKPKLVFHCQQAHGSPTACISGFCNVKELYSAVATSFELDPQDVRPVVPVQCY